jgi:hypothetical protein
LCLRRGIEVTSRKAIIKANMMNDDIPLKANPPGTGTIIQTRSLKTTRHPLATVVEDLIIPPTRNVQNMDNQNQQRRCTLLESDQ